MRNQRGISLVVLVITIIVMIILAGAVVINLSNTGVISKANDAVNKTNLAELKTDITKKLLMKGWYEGKDVEPSKFENYLKSVSGATVTKVIEDAWEVKRGNTIVTIYETGEIINGAAGIWDGTSEATVIKEGNWYIYTAKQMKFFADFVNNGSTLTAAQKALVQKKGYNEADYVITDNTIVYLMNDLDMGARQKDGVKTIGNAWTPIGPSKALKFTGTFEGNNHTIRGVYVYADGSPAGIFGNSDTIQNLTIKDSYIEATETVAGGIAGALREGNMVNCHNVSTEVAVGTSTAGGLVGQFTGIRIYECSNTGKIREKNGYQGFSCCGGIVGIVNSNPIEAKIENCYNKGNISGTGKSIGGIVGHMNKKSSIIGCVNTGTIQNELGCIGGIAGTVYGEIQNCYNAGMIIAAGNGTKYIGGIAGILGQFNNEVHVTIIRNTYNIGTIKILENNAAEIGGIIGGVTTTGIYDFILSNNYNVGKIEIVGMGATYLGAIIGRVTPTSNPEATTIIATNNYYLSGMTDSADNTIGEPKTSVGMKTEAFVELLNTGLTKLAWEIRAGENSGYPVLKGLK